MTWHKSQHIKKLFEKYHYITDRIIKVLEEKIFEDFKNDKIVFNHEDHIEDTIDNLCNEWASERPNESIEVVEYFGVFPAIRHHNEEYDDFKLNDAPLKNYSLLAFILIKTWFNDNYEIYPDSYNIPICCIKWNSRYPNKKEST